MCGIVGYVGANAPRLIPFNGTILDAIRYRGRDSESIWTDGAVATLMNTRLSIIDIEGGRQPMHDQTGRYVLVFNGAIYNYRELRDEYRNAGARFRTRSDTEVILEGFALKGERVLQDLNGMFAFAIWDMLESRLFLARDRLGKKPLFWTRLGDVLVFSSTIDAFRSLPGWDGALSNHGLTLYSFLGGFPGQVTAFAHAHALPAACFAWFKCDNRDPIISRYWLPNYAAKTRGSESQLIEEYDAILSDAIRLRLRSDVPLALSFSGGTDSGTIAALAKYRFNSNLACYTIDHDSPEEPSDEVAVARAVARKLDLPWTHIEYQYRTEILEGLPQAYRYFDQPCQQLPLVYSYRLYSVMHPHCTVVLSGNGADELFTGYNGDHAHVGFDKARRWLRYVPEWAFRRLPPVRRSEWHHARMEQLTIPDWVRVDMLRHADIFTADANVKAACAQVADELAHEYEAAGIDTLLDLIMHRALIVSATDTNYRLPDITGYAAQVEVRSPFFDHRMVEFAARLPHRYKVGRRSEGLRPKYLPRLFYERFVGPEIAWGPKRGMAANLRWDLELVRNPRFAKAMSAAFDAIREHGLDAEPFRAAQMQYRADVENKSSNLPTAGVMMNGFMLGVWLQSKAVPSLTLVG